MASLTMEQNHLKQTNQGRHRPERRRMGKLEGGMVLSGEKTLNLDRIVGEY